jgi:hypothetical protein
MIQSAFFSFSADGLMRTKPKKSGRIVDRAESR